jgi:hypothetical protein
MLMHMNIYDRNIRERKHTHTHTHAYLPTLFFGTFSGANKVANREEDEVFNQSSSSC